AAVRAECRLPAADRLERELMPDYPAILSPGGAGIAHRHELQRENDPVIPVGLTQWRGVDMSAGAVRTVHFRAASRHHHQPALTPCRHSAGGDRVATAQASGLADGLDFEKLLPGAICIGLGQRDLVGCLTIEEISPAGGYRASRLGPADRPEGH